MEAGGVGQRSLTADLIELMVGGRTPKKKSKAVRIKEEDVAFAVEGETMTVKPGVTETLLLLLMMKGLWKNMRPNLNKVFFLTSQFKPIFYQRYQSHSFFN